MKCFLLLVIFAVAQYQETTGFPRNIPNDSKQCSETYASLEKSSDTEKEVQNAEMKIQVIETEENVYKPLLKSLRHDERGFSFPLKFPTSIKDLNPLHQLDFIEDHDTTDEDIEDQLTLEDVALDDKIEDDSVNQQQHKFGHSIKLPFANSLLNNIMNRISLKIEHMKLSYIQFIENIMNILKNYIQNVIKDKNKKDQSTLENIASGDKAEINATQTTSTLDESVVNQQFSDENDDSEFLDESEENESKCNKKPITSESSVSSEEIKENAPETNYTIDDSVVNQQSTPSPDENDDKENESKYNKKLIISVSPISSDEIKENAPQTNYITDDSGFDGAVFVISK